MPSTERPGLPVEIRGLTKSFGTVRDVDGLDLVVGPGAVTGDFRSNHLGIRSVADARTET